MTEIEIHIGKAATVPARDIFRPATLLVEAWRAWRRRARNRRVLDDLDSATLHDIGLERGPHGYRPSAGLPERHYRRVAALGTSFGLFR